MCKRFHSVRYDYGVKSFMVPYKNAYLLLKNMDARDSFFRLQNITMKIKPFRKLSLGIMILTLIRFLW